MVMEQTGYTDPERTRGTVALAAGQGGGQRFEGQSSRKFTVVQEDTSYIRYTNPVTGAVLFDRRFWGSGKDYPQLILKLRAYNPKGYRTIGTPTVVLPYEYTRVGKVLDEYYARAIYQAQVKNNYRHTPASITASELLPELAAWYVPSVANLRTLLSMVGMFELNDAFRTLRKNFVTKSKIRRLISLHEQFESIPMVNYWRNQAVNMAGVFTDQEGGTPVITLYNIVAGSATGETPTSLKDGMSFAGAAGADVADTVWEAVITNAEKALKVLQGYATTAAWNTDVRALMDLWRMVDVPMGLPKRPDAEVRTNAFMITQRLKYSALAAKSIPTGSDKMLIWPKVSTINEMFVRPFEGEPDAFWYAGICDLVVWYMDVGDDRTVKTGYQIGTLTPDWAEDEHADGIVWYTIEDGWSTIPHARDLTDLDKYRAVMRAPDLRNHVWNSELSHEGADYGSSDPSAYGAARDIKKMEVDLQDVADGFYNTMVAALDFAVA